MARFAQTLFGRFFELLGHICYTLRFEGLEYLQELEPPVIFVCNHKTWIDHFLIIAGALRRKGLVPIHVLVHDDIWARPLYRAVCKFLGAYPANSGKGIEVSLAPLRQELSRGECVGLYPEGRTERRKNMFREPKVGPAYLAFHTQRQVFPMAIKGLEELRWQRDFFFGHRRVVLKFGPPFKIEKGFFSAGGPEEIIEKEKRRIMETIIALYNSIPDYLGKE